MKTVIVIPARKGSTRFPNKPMTPILGQQLLLRTWRIAKAVRGVDEVYVATDDNTIGDLAERNGAKVLYTRPECENGSARTFEAIQRLESKPDLIVNLQGDAVLTPPTMIQEIIDVMKQDASIPIATPAVQLDWQEFDQFLSEKAGGRASGTMVVCDRFGKALYFSKAIIPFIRDQRPLESPMYRHIGLYAYRYEALAKYVSLAPTKLEMVEKLEQLRFLENGIPIRVVVVDCKGRTQWSIDNPEDVSIAEEIIRREGELVA